MFKYSNVNKVYLLSERTSGVPPVIFVFKIMFQEEVDCTEVDYTSEISDKGKGCMQ